MKLVFILGDAAVGKMTVGQELMKRTELRLFHNHMAIEPVIEIFGKYDGAAVARIREVVFEEFMKTDYSGMIFTYMWAFDLPSDWEYIANVAKRFEETGGTVYYVELVADRAVRLERNKTENRLRNKASKRDLVISQDRMIRSFCKTIRDARSSQYSALVQVVLYALEHDYAKDVSLPLLAQEMNVSESHLIAAFKKEVGVTPNRYLNTVRMKQAALLLIHGSMTVSGVSEAVGIMDSNYFVKLFRKEFGETPSAYRKRYTV